MSDIFISYAREDKARAEVLARALERQGYAVWWDPDVLPGEAFTEVIQRALQRAGCVIVLWSKASARSSWVLAEAETGRLRGVLVPARIEQVEIPPPFTMLQTADLTGWYGDPAHPEFARLLGGVRTTVEHAPPPPEPMPTDEERLSAMRAELIRTHSEEDLRRLSYAVDAFLEEQPHNVEARLLKRKAVQALVYAERPLEEMTQETLGGRASRPGCMLIGAALAILLGVLAYLFF